MRICISSDTSRFGMRFIKLVFGLFLYALGIIISIDANVGYAPWDVFHVGLAKTSGLTIGTVSILTGLVIVFITTALGEKFGMGTVLNMLLIGIFMDIIIRSKLIPVAGTKTAGFAMLFIGLVTVAFASFFYISSAFGTGPRDGLMVALSRKLHLSVGLCRGIIELAATIAGYFLGGMLGIGTLVYVLAVGLFIQVVFKLLHFDPKTVTHESIHDTYRFLRSKLCAKHTRSH